MAAIDDVSGAARRVASRASYLVPDMDPSDRERLARLATRSLKPDTAYDELATAQRRALAAAAVMPVFLSFRRNQLIVGEGGEVTRETLLVLEHLRLQGLPQAFFARATGTSAVTALLLIGALWLPFPLKARGFSLRDGLCVLTVIVGTAAAFHLWLMLIDGVSLRAPGLPRQALVLAFPITTAPMIATIVLERRLVAAVVAMMAIVMGLSSDLGAYLAAHAFVVGLVAAQLVSGCGQRSCVIRAGAQSGGVAVLAGAGVFWLASPDGGTVEGLVVLAGAFAGGLGGALVTLAISRPFESVFGYSTRLRLVELLSYDHPLMRLFMERAPGTFQHSVAVALLATRAAEAIDADTMLVRVGALYHDVGKIEQPEYFTENQRGPNPHDHTAPDESARIILGHVEHGLRLLKEHGVPGNVADFVREHQGTGVLTRFQEQAAAAGMTVDPDRFRYAGPRPRSRETAVLMIADKIEAIARSLAETGAEDLEDVVDRTITGLVNSGELSGSPLTLTDLGRLRPAFVEALRDLHHKRVAYAPVSAPAGQHGSQDV